MNRIEETKAKIVEIIQREYRNGMVNMFEGNVSARVGDTILITPSQVAKDATTPEMIIEMDLEGNITHLPEGMKPSSESKMHLEVYRLRKDVQAVVHNHSIYATAFAMNNMPIETKALTEVNMTLGVVPVCAYGTPGTERIYADLKNKIGNGNAVLLANHGLLTYGPNLEIAYSFAEGVEKIAQTITIAGRIGEPSNIPDEEIEGLRQYGSMARDKAIAEALK
ncbi:MAG: class II aldolase/adducin family protein [Clostridiales bacterium]|nr:class II aldolase/adducin family protein [Candidatus Crickella merdequi]